MRRIGTVCLLLAVVCAGRVQAQETGELDARSRELAHRMRTELEQQARVLSQMQKDLERAAGLQPRARDSIVRVTSSRIGELAGEIARIQAEANRAQLAGLDVQTKAQIQAQLSSARAMANMARVLAGQQRALTYSSVNVASAPRGYLGVTLTGDQRVEVRDGKVVTVFQGPTLIESVEAGSPAALAGLEAGDTVVAFGRLQLPGLVSLSDVMQPGERLPVRIRRRGSERVVPVTVGTRPSDSFGGPASLTITGSASAPASASCSGCARGTTPAVRGFPVPPASPASPRALVWSSNDLSVAGATMTTVTDELEELTGVDEGILVLRVAPGTPAATSGLRGGDVIVRIGEDDAEEVRDLQMAVQRASSRGTRQVELAVLRQKRERTVTLKW